MPEVNVHQSATDHPAKPLTGRKVGRFVIGPRVGAGGMGEVYRAEDPKLKRPVALKRVAPRLRADPVYRGRLLKEAQRASALNDEHIARIYDVLEEEDEILLVMEYVDGATLRERLRKPLPAKAFLGIAIQCVRALVAAHEKGVVHCDIKPENIMLTARDHVKILDFGVARRLPTVQENATTETLDSRPGMLMGTPAYLAPEVLQGKPPDGRADLFSLGVVFYEALSGRHPFLASTFVATTDRILHETPPTLAQLNPEVPPELERVVAKLLAKDPADRYATAADLLVDLRALARALNYPALPTPPSTPWVPDRRRTWAVRVAILLTLAVAVALVVWLWIRRPPATAERESILVADFENRTGDTFFDPTVRELLTLALEQSRYLSIFPRSRTVETLRRMQRPQVVRLDHATAREVCLRESLSTLVDGEIIPVTNGFEIVVRIVDPYTDVTRGVVNETLQSKEHLWQSLDHLSAQLRGILGESRSLIVQNSRPLADVTTRSLKALERFSHALDLQAQGRIEEGLVLLKTAVILDPEFAMADGRLAISQEALGQEDDALASATRAHRLRDRVSERERYLIDATYHFLRGEYEEAAENFRTVTILHPEDATAYDYLADSYAALGKLEEAIGAAKRAAELNPGSLIAQGLPIVFLAEAGHYDEAIRQSQAAKAKHFAGTYLHWGEGLAWLGKGDVGRARDEFRALAQGGGVYESAGRLYLAQTVIYEGKAETASEQLEADLQFDLKSQNESDGATCRYWLAQLHLLRDRRKRALDELQALSRQKTLPTHLQELRVGALLYAEMGEQERAQRILGQTEQIVREFPSTFSQGVAAQVRGELEWADGRAEAARQDLERAHAQWGDVSTLWSLARFWEAQGDYSRALDLYKEVITRKGEVLRLEFSGLWVLANLRAAHCLRRLNDYSQAVRYYDDFLLLWGSSPTEIPLVREVWQERKNLPTRPSRNLRTYDSKTEGGHHD